MNVKTFQLLQVKKFVVICRGKKYNFLSFSAGHVTQQTIYECVYSSWWFIFVYGLTHSLGAWKNDQEHFTHFTSFSFYFSFFTFFFPPLKMSAQSFVHYTTSDSRIMSNNPQSSILNSCTSLLSVNLILNRSDTPRPQHAAMLLPRKEKPYKQLNLILKIKNRVKNIF